MNFVRLLVRTQFFVSGCVSSFFNVWWSFGLSFVSKVLTLLGCACMFVWRGVEMGEVHVVALLTQLTVVGERLWSMLSVIQASSFWSVCAEFIFHMAATSLLWDFCPIFVLFLLCSSVIGRVVIFMLAPEFISGMVDVGVISHCFMQLAQCFCI